MWASFRNLSLNNDNFPAMIENVDGLLRTITINIYKNPVKRISWIFYTLTIVAALCYTYVYLFSMLWLVIIHYARTKNFTGAIVALSLGTCSITCITKFLFMILHLTHIRDTVEKFLAFDAQVVRRSRFELNLRKHLRAVKKRAIIIWIFLVLDGALYAIIPYLRPGRHVAQDLFILYGIPLIWYVLTIAAGGCYFYVYIFSMMWQVFIHYPRLNNFAGAAVALTLGTCTVTCITKFVFMKMYANDIKETVDKVLQCDDQVVPDTKFAKNLRIKLRIVKKRAIVIWVSLVSDGMIYLMIPLVMPGRHVSEDLYIIYGLEPMLESPNYEIVTFLTNTSIGFAVYTMVNVAVYVIVIVGYNEAQIHALSEELRNIRSDSQNFYNKIKHSINDKIHAIYIKEKIVNEFIRIRLRDIIKFHIANINLFHPLAVEYSTMTISIIAELLGGLQNTYLQLPYTMVQVFMDCLAGQRLIDACNDFETSLYACEWENFNVSNRRTVLLMLVASQTTLVLTAGGVTKLNFNCLMIIVKSTYSAYTTLKSTLK